MRFVSTRGDAPAVTFSVAMTTGLAPDGGLYVPEQWPVLTGAELRGLRGKSYADVAFTVLKPFVGGEIADADLKTMIDAAYASFAHKAVVPLKQLPCFPHCLSVHSSRNPFLLHAGAGAAVTRQFNFGEGDEHFGARPEIAGLEQRLLFRDAIRRHHRERVDERLAAGQRSIAEIVALVSKGLERSLEALGHIQKRCGARGADSGWETV